MRGPRIQWTEALRQHAARRLQFTLSRFSQNISMVTLEIPNAAPKPGSFPKTTSRITVRLLPKGIVHCEDDQNDLYAAISLLSEHAGRAVQRTLDRERIFRPRLK